MIHLHKIMKAEAELDKAHIQSLLWNYEELSPLITNVDASYTRLLRSLDVVVRNYDTSLISMLRDAKEKNKVRLELDAYFD